MFDVVSSMGIPLEIVLDVLSKKRMVIDWVDFVQSSLEEGWKIDRTLIKIESAVGDVLGPEEREKVVERIKFFIRSSRQAII